MKILIINAGSSSLKYQFIDMDSEYILAKGICERIGTEESLLIHTTHDKRSLEKSVYLRDHKQAFQEVVNALVDENSGVISSLRSVDAIGHRVVQGGAIFKKSALIDQNVLNGIELLIPLAPLHNKAHAQAIRACFHVFGKSIPEVAVFDTAFHTTMPPKSFIYPIPYKYYEKFNIRKYGFHGTSHKYVSNRCAELIGKNLSSLKIITCHLGSGSSITAIERGRVLDTSMGLTPLEGLVMGTRSGSIDPSVITFIEKEENLSAEQVNKILNKESGLLGISGVSGDIRDLDIAARSGNTRAKLAQKIFEHQIIKFIGGYIAVMNGVDAIVFTAGIGENHVRHRKRICDSFSYVGLELDDEVNSKTFAGREAKITTNSSKIDVFVIPTNEELMIARETLTVVKNTKH